MFISGHYIKDITMYVYTKYILINIFKLDKIIQV